MNTRNALIVIGLIVIAGAASGAYLQFFSPQVATEEPGQVAGAVDYSTVPDGMPETADVRIGETVTIMGARITPTEVLEDSRCPTDVQCIQAGTVRLLASVVARGASEDQAQPYQFELGVPMAVGPDQATLITVAPEARSDVEIAPEDYVFTITVTKGSGAEYYKG